ncbi:membrane protein [Cellulophaga baltica]|uniref:membrane protein n=1 Tax=Cellulophaga baltica TaxID=76594 RepID=UPI0004122936|nr:membrane protein [Cellulophaga baltica]
MIKKIFVAIVLLSSIGLSAQNGTVSPYSYFGLGDTRNSGTVDNQMMGGISMVGDSIHINLKNPAAYSKLMLTTYAAGISYNNIGLKTSDASQSTSVTNLDYLSIGVPLGKGFGMGFGLMPFTSVGYDLETSTTVDDVTIINNYAGDGGLNRVYFSLGYQLLDDISIGATVNYNFGTINSTRVQTSSDAQYGALDRRETQVGGFDFNYSINYTPKISEKYTLYTTIGVDTQINLNAENSQSIGSFSRVTGQEIEVVDVNLDAQARKFAPVRIPTKTTLGVGIGEDLKWFLGAEYTFQELSTYRNDFFEVDNLTYNDASGFAIGGYFVPEYNSFTSYYKRITYRAGLRLSQTGMKVNNEDINDFGITFGTGLPLGRDISNLNIGFEIGKRGTKDAGLIKENYFKVNIGLSLNDRWFRKRKIN